MKGVLAKSPVRRVLILVGGTGASQLITLFALPIVTRLYEPAEFALFGVFLAVFGVCSSVVSLNYDFALIGKHTEEEAETLFRLSLLVGILGSLIFTCAFSLLWVFQLFGIGRLSILAIPLFFVTLVLFTINSTWRYYAMQHGYFKQVSSMRVSQALTRAIGQVLAGVTGGTALGLLIAEMSSYLGGARESFLVVRRNFRTPIRWQAIKRVAYQHRNFPLYIAPSTVLGVGASSLLIPIVFALYGAASAGFLALTQRIVSLPISLVGTSLADIFQKSLVEKSDGFNSFIRVFVSRLVFVVTMVTVAGFVILPPAITFVFGEQWSASGVLAAHFLGWSAAQFVVGIVGRLSYIIGAQRIKLWQDAYNALLVVVVLSISGLWQVDLSTALLTISCLSLLGAVVYIIVLIGMSKKWRDGR